LSTSDPEFWQLLDRLVSRNRLVLDRPKGAEHPRFPGQQYPLDYGYLEGTTTVDGGGIDIWIGTNGPARVTGVLCTVDLVKQDTELKILLGCTSWDVEQILLFINGKDMRALYLPRQEPD